MNMISKYETGNKDIIIEVSDAECSIRLNGLDGVVEIDNLNSFLDIVETFRIAGVDFKERVYRIKGFDKID